MVHILSLAQIAGSTACLMIVSTVLGDALARLLARRSRNLLVRLAAGAGVGLLLLIGSTAAVLAAGWSSAFGVLLLAAAAAWNGERRTWVPAHGRMWIISLTGLAIGAALYSVWLAHWHVNEAGAVLRAPLQRDTPHYVVLTAFLDRVGVETPQPHFLVGVASSRAPYHYLDAWLAVLVSRLFRASHLVAYIAIAQALLAATLTMALAALVTRLARVRSVTGVACALIALLAGAEPLARAIGELSMGSAVEKLFGGLELYVMPPFEVNKVHPGTILLVFALLTATFRRSRRAAPWLLAALPTVYFTFAPFVAAAFAVMMTSALMRGARREAFNTALALAIGLALLVPTLEWSRDEGFFFLQQGTAFPNVSRSEFILGAVRVVGGAAARLSSLLGVILTISWLTLRATRRLRLVRSLYLPVLVGLGASVGAWAVAHRSIDSWQLVTTTSSAVLAIVTAIATGNALLGWVRFRRVPGSALQVGIAVSLAGLAFAYHHARFEAMADRFDNEVPASLRRIASERVPFESSPTPRIGLWVRGPMSFRDVYDYNLGSSTHALAFLLSDHPYTAVLPLGSPPLSDGLLGERQRAMLNRSPLVRATKAVPGDDRWQNEVVPLILSQQIGYALVDPGVVPDDQLAARLADCSTEEKTGLRLCAWR